jgi:glutamate racemase
MGHAMTEMAVGEYLAPLKTAGVDTLILGCTHYPALKGDIGLYMGPEVTLVDSADALAEAAEDRLAELDLLRGEADRAGELKFYLSDIPWKFQEIGARFLGQPIHEVNTVGLDEMEALGRQHD